MESQFKHCFKKTVLACMHGLCRENIMDQDISHQAWSKFEGAAAEAGELQHASKMH